MCFEHEKDNMTFALLSSFKIKRELKINFERRENQIDISGTSFDSSFFASKDYLLMIKQTQ